MIRRKEQLTWIIIFGLLVISLNSLHIIKNSAINQNNFFVPKISSDTEPNNSFAEATEVYNNDNWTGYYYEHTDPVDYYKIYLQNSDILTIKANFYNLDMSFYYQIYNTTQHQIFSYSSHESQFYETNVITNTSGYIFFSVNGYEGYYNFETLINGGTGPGPGPDDLEPNDDFSTASPLTFDENGNPTIQLTIDPAGEVDFYSIQLDQGDDINILLWNLPANYDIAFFYPNQSLVSESTNTGTTNDQIIHNDNILAGTYYIRVSDSDFVAGNYSLTVNLYKSGPPSPTLIYPTNDLVTNNNQPTFEWSEVVDAAQYHLQVSDESNYLSLVIDENTTEITFVADEMVDDTYYWHVQVQNIDGNWSDWSETSTFVIDVTPPSPPVLISPINGTITNTSIIDYLWESADGVEYLLQISMNITFIDLLVDENLPTTNFTYEVMEDGYYYWRVKARDAAGNWGDWSEDWNVTKITPSSNNTQSLGGYHLISFFGISVMMLTILLIKKRNKIT